MLVAGMRAGEARAQQQYEQEAAMREKDAQIQQAQQQAQQAATAQPSTTDELQKLADLHKSGVLSDEEFAAMKKKLLGL